MTAINTDIIDVSIADILNDDFFKVSKRNYPSNLEISLKVSGMVEIPYIFKSGAGFKLLTCHNRIELLRESGITHVKCAVLAEPDPYIFMNHVSLKIYRNEIGPFGKLKTLSLLNSFFNIDETARRDYSTKILKLPSEIIDNELYLKKIIEFPQTLAGFIDDKDINFKLIKDIALLPENWILLINNWLKSVQMRVNIFRILIDNMYDIYRRGDDISSVESILFSDDKTLHDGIYRIRYPEYSELKMKSDYIISEISSAGLTIDFPEFFDKRFLTIKLDIDKNADCSGQLKKITKLNVEKLKELLSYL